MRFPKCCALTDFTCLKIITWLHSIEDEACYFHSVLKYKVAEILPIRGDASFQQVDKSVLMSCYLIGTGIFLLSSVMFKW